MIAGVIEGFYGPPWSTDDRLECVALLDALGANAFVWAGKSEPRHRDAWREPFTDVELSDFARLAAHRPNVGLHVGLTPGADATASEVAEKLRPAIDRGARGVALLFDDLPVLDAADRHRDIANSVESTLGRPVWLTPTHYAGTTSSPYLERLFDGLSPTVEVMWTGTHVVNDRITGADAAARRAACAGRAPLLWDNTPVNDAMMSEALHLGPYHGRGAELREQVSGVLVNPMTFARASLPTVASAMAWCRGDDPLTAWDREIDRRGWRRLAEATAFPDDPHWPGARPDREWWASVSTMTVPDLDPGCDPWVEAAREGARLALRALDIIESRDTSPDGDPQERVVASIGLAIGWRAWKRGAVLTFGGGPRLRPVLTNDASGRFTYDGRSITDSTSLVDDLVRRATR